MKTSDGHARLADLLAKCPLFADLPDDRLAQLAAATRERHYAGGEIILAKGERPDTLLLVNAAGSRKPAILPAAGNASSKSSAPTAAAAKPHSRSTGRCPSRSSR